MRFSIRDLLWATVVVAMGLAWWVSYRAMDAKCLAAVQQSHRLWYELDMARNSFELFSKHIDEVDEDKLSAPLVGWHLFRRVNWNVLDEPLVQPLPLGDLYTDDP